MTDAAIEVRGLSKKYRLGGLRSIDREFREMIADTARGLLRRIRHPRPKPADEFWALRDVSFEVRQGEVLGVIGRNGAGKSTLLKILSRITDPTEGHAILDGRVGSLLEVGTGFHPELTGRENIYLSGVTLGMRKKEIDAKFDEIVAFSEIEKFLDTPVKRYSSGMYVRLAFAVAAHLEPEILLIDEVLAVGDAGFQKKCLGKMNDVAGSGRTILFVSHNMAAISSLCDQAILIDGGRLVQHGPSSEVVRSYFESMEDRSRIDLADRTDRGGDGVVRLTALRVLDTVSGHSLDGLCAGQDVTIEVTYDSPVTTPLRNVNIALAFFTPTGQFLLALNSQASSNAFGTLPAKGKVYCRMERCPLMSGNFVVKTTVKCNGAIADQVEHAAVIKVEPGDFFGTGRVHSCRHQGIYVPHTWSTRQIHTRAA